MTFLATAITFIKANKWLSIGVGVFLAIILIFALGRCSGGDEAGQAKQGNKTNEALATSAQEAVNDIVSTNSNAQSVDAIVDQAAQEIDNAPNELAARDAAYNALCRMRAYANDPACAVFKPRP